MNATINHDSSLTPVLDFLGGRGQSVSANMTEGVVSSRVNGGGNEYLGQYNFGEYLNYLQDRFPQVYRLLDLSHPTKVQEVLKAVFSAQTGFETASKGGRGDAYRTAQKRRPLARRRGVRGIFEIVEQNSPAVILDALGGSGSMTRVRRHLDTDFSRPSPLIVTSDLDAAQIAAALDEGFPAIRQAAQHTLFRDQSFDTVLFAFGTHHLPPRSRPAAWREARRILKTGGRIVIHDFETGTPTERWYSEVLHLGTETGHACEHFAPKELWRDLLEAGFRDVRIHYLYEPFVLEGETGEKAVVTAMRHIVNLFGLEKIRPDKDTPAEWLRLVHVLAKYFTIPETIPLDKPFEKHIVVRQTKRHYEAEFPRVALIATATR